MSLCVDDRLVCRSEFIPISIPDGHLHRVKYTRCRIDTINSPDDGHMAARNMWRTEINTQEKTVHKTGLFAKIVLRCAVNNT